MTAGGGPRMEPWYSGGQSTIVANDLHLQKWSSDKDTGLVTLPHEASPSEVRGLSAFAGWRRERGDAPLLDVHRTVEVARTGPAWKRLLSYFGPGYLIAVGYMDPGNWATSLAGGSEFGYRLLAVALVSNIMAIVLQSLATRLAVGSGRDLAQSCRDGFPKWASVPLWALAELAIVATDLAEVIGTAIGLKLLFDIPLAAGVMITALDVFLVLFLQRLGFRYLEAFVVAGLAVIAFCFGIQMLLAKPEWSEVARGFVPTADIVTNPHMLYLALGILGATVMPHNLYLHSAIVGTRNFGTSVAEKREAYRFATIDSTIALMLALLINASILILAAAAFHQRGRTDVVDLTQAHDLLSPLLGPWAPTLFAVALIACGLNSTVTATLAGQAVMEGFLELRIAPWLRRLTTRLVAIIPAAAVTILAGEQATAKLLILSQVVLSLQLPFAVLPLVYFTAQKSKLGELVAPRWLSVFAWVIAAAIIILNVKLIVDFMSGGLGGSAS